MGVPGSFDVDLHDALLAKYCRMLWQRLAPLEAAKPKKQWLTPETWQQVRVHADHRKAFFSAVRGRNQDRIRLALHTWLRRRGSRKCKLAKVEAKYRESCHRAAWLGWVLEEVSYLT